LSEKASGRGGFAHEGHDERGVQNMTNSIKNTGNKLLLPHYDIAFKSIFKDENNQDVVEDFLKAVLDIPKDEKFEEIIVRDPELLPEAEDEKLSILDVLLKIPGKGYINVELQMYTLPEMKERIVHYWARTASRQLTSGESYAKFNRVITIVIAGFNFINDSEHYHNRYFLYDKEHDSRFTDLVEFDILELKKLPAKSDDTETWKWAKFFGSGSDAELRAAAGGSEKIAKAMLTIEKLSADEEARVRAEYREMQRRDYVSRIEGAKREGRAEREGEIARRMAELGKSDAEITEILGHNLT
jgi:predicted transposase/invertase (TIGR01784 family)